MMIDSAATFHVSLPLRRRLRSARLEIESLENILVELACDGLVGSGYAFTFSESQAIAIRHVIHDLAESLVGQDPRSTREHLSAMSARLRHTGRTGIGLMALSALDMALWDIRARMSDLPLFRYLGGHRSALAVYATGGFLSQPVEQLVDEAMSLEEQGISYYKMKVGSPDWRKDVERLRFLRSEIGDGLRIMVDAGEAWTVSDALDAGLAFEDSGVYWYEDPIDAADFIGFLRLGRKLKVRLASGESIHGLEGLRALIEQRAADVVMPDLGHAGGPSGLMAIADFAAGHNQLLSPHLFPEVNAHLMSSLPNAGLIEYVPGWWDGLFDPPPVIVEGHIRLLEEPGLGFRFSEDAKRRWSKFDTHVVLPV